MTNKNFILIIVGFIACFGFYILGKVYSHWFVIPQLISTIFMLKVLYAEAKGQ